MFFFVEQIRSVFFSQKMKKTKRRDSECGERESFKLAASKVATMIIIIATYVNVCLSNKNNSLQNLFIQIILSLSLSLSLFLCMLLFIYFSRRRPLSRRESETFDSRGRLKY